MANLSPAERLLAYQAAALALRRPNRAEDAVRVTNAISKIFAQIGFADKRRRREPEESREGLHEYAARVAREKRGAACWRPTTSSKSTLQVIDRLNRGETVDPGTHHALLRDELGKVQLDELRMPLESLRICRKPAFLWHFLRHPEI